MLKQDPTMAAARNTLGALRLKQGQVAAAVALFDKANPSLTFSRLGPLAQRYPKSQSVRFHLGLCLLWLGSVKTQRTGVFFPKCTQALTAFC